MREEFKFCIYIEDRFKRLANGWIGGGRGKRVHISDMVLFRTNRDQQQIHIDENHY